MTIDYVLWMKRTERSIEQRMGRFCVGGIQESLALVAH